MTAALANAAVLRDWPFASVGAARSWATLQLSTAGLDEPTVEADVLLAGLFGWTRTRVYVESSRPLSPRESALFRQWISRRCRREPVAYILGRQEFHGMDFEVGPEVLIPRPETECLVEISTRLIERHGIRRPRILEIGTGSGCLSVALAATVPAATILSLDVSAAALEVAGRNAARNNVAERIEFMESDLYFSLGKPYFGYFDLIVSNPPYISTVEMANLGRDISYEPKRAIDGGSDGLRILYPLIRQSAIYLGKPGFVLLEIGHRQADAVEAIFKRAGFQGNKRWPDWFGRDRVVGGAFSGSI